MVDDTNLDVAIHHVERVLADQLNSVNSLSNKASVALGFVVTVFGALFSLSRDAIHAHLAAAVISAGFPCHLGHPAVLIVLGDEVRRSTESGRVTSAHRWG